MCGSVFALKKMCENYLEKHEDLHSAFMDLENAKNRIDRVALWNVLQIYGEGGYL